MAKIVPVLGLTVLPPLCSGLLKVSIVLKDGVGESSGVLWWTL